MQDKMDFTTNTSTSLLPHFLNDIFMYLPCPALSYIFFCFVEEIIYFHLFKCITK